MSRGYSWFWWSWHWWYYSSLWVTTGMTSITDIANRALSSIGTRSQIADLSEDSNEARSCRLLLEPLRDEVLRLAPWNCAFNYANLDLICSAPGTPENPTAGEATWNKGIPPPPWSYEYAFPSDCLRAVFIVPQFTTGFTSGVPITTAVTGGAPVVLEGTSIAVQGGCRPDRTRWKARSSRPRH